MDRRHFLRAGTAALAAMTLSNRAAAWAADKPKRVGLIGCGWYGKSDLFRLLQVSPVEVVSLCDVDRKMLAEAAEMVAARQQSKKAPRTYADYRKMLEEKDLDIVLVGTPDHWHALTTIAAIESGADVYVEKPLSTDVVEGRAMLAAARKNGRVVQVGLQRRSTPHLIEARDKIIRTGKLGRIGLVEIYCYYQMRARGNPPDTNPPAELDYEMWTGPAPMRPFNAWVHPRGWRAFMEYGNGILGDMCVHMFDMTRWMLELGWPKRIACSGGIRVEKESKSNTPDTQSAAFEYDDLTVVWQHRSWGEPADPKYPWGATFYGDKGTLKAGVFGYDFYPSGGGQPIHIDVTYEFEQFPEDKTERDLERHVAAAVRGHMRNFLTAIDERSKPVSDIEQGYISTTACILANLSMQLGRSLAWDPQKDLVTNDEEANRLLRRPYRTPWIHPEPTGA